MSTLNYLGRTFIIPKEFDYSSGSESGVAYTVFVCKGGKIETGSELTAIEKEGVLFLFDSSRHDGLSIAYPGIEANQLHTILQSNIILYDPALKMQYEVRQA